MFFHFPKNSFCLEKNLEKGTFPMASKIPRYQLFHDIKGRGLFQVLSHQVTWKYILDSMNPLSFRLYYIWNFLKPLQCICAYSRGVSCRPVAGKLWCTSGSWSHLNCQTSPWELDIKGSTPKVGRKSYSSSKDAVAPIVPGAVLSHRQLFSGLQSLFHSHH